MISLEEIRQELYADLKRWEQRMIDKIQHDRAGHARDAGCPVRGDREKGRPDR
jgi:hypothetical protein